MTDAGLAVQAGRSCEGQRRWRWRASGAAPDTLEAQVKADPGDLRLFFPPFPPLHAPRTPLLLSETHHLLKLTRNIPLGGASDTSLFPLLCLRRSHSECGACCCAQVQSTMPKRRRHTSLAGGARVAVAASPGATAHDAGRQACAAHHAPRQPCRLPPLAVPLFPSDPHAARKSDLSIPPRVPITNFRAKIQWPAIKWGAPKNEPLLGPI